MNTSIPFPPATDACPAALIDEAEALLVHPDFRQALTTYAEKVLALYHGTGFSRLLINETARAVMANMCIVLDALAEDDAPLTGLTISRLQDACSLMGVASRGRVFAFVKMMERNGFLEERPSLDKRTRPLAPTARLFDYQHQLIGGVLAAADILMPERRNMASFGMAHLQRRFVRLTGQDMIRGVTPYTLHEDILLFSRRDGGFQFLLQLLRQAGLFDMPPPSTALPSLSELSRSCGLSRSHLRSLLADGEACGLLVSGGGRKHTITATKLLQERFRQHVAVLIAYYSGMLLKAA